MYEKYRKDGKVAVLISPGYGAGWWTWNQGQGYGLLFDREIVQAVLDNDKNKAKQIAESKYPEAYTGGVRDLEVRWLNEGTRFTIDEYDGHEAIKLIEDLVIIA